MAKFKPQFKRLIFIDSLLRRGSYPTCASIAREYEVSERTIMRDIEYMRDMMEAPIEYDSSKRGFYYTEQSYMLPAVSVSESELFALCIAEKVLEQYKGTPLYGTLEAVFQKLSGLLPDGVQVGASWLGGDYSFIPDSTVVMDAGIWEVIAAAMRGRMALSIDHRKASGEVTKRIVYPYHLAAYKGQWYLIAYCTKRKEVLRFAVSRISRAELSKEHYEVPKDFNFSEFIGNSFGIMDDRESFTAKVCFSPGLAPYIAERTWHAQQEVTQHADGSLTLSFPATSRLEVRQWVMSWGSGAKVLGPEELVAEVKEELLKAVGVYT